MIMNMIMTAGILMAGLCSCPSSAAELNLATVGPDTVLTVEYNETIDLMEQPQFSLGRSHSGDINGDGCDDMILEYHYYQRPEMIDMLKIVTVSGSLHGKITVDILNDPDIAFQDFYPAKSPMVFGDINDDGFDDMIQGYAFRSQLDLYFGSLTFNDSGQMHRLVYNYGGSDFGRHLSVADFNHDGIDDLVIAAPFDIPRRLSAEKTAWVDPTFYPGTVRILMGSPSLLYREGASHIYDINDEDSVTLIGTDDAGRFGSLLATGAIDYALGIDVIVGSMDKITNEIKLNIVFNPDIDSSEHIRAMRCDHLIPDDFRIDEIKTGNVDGNSCDDIIYYGMKDGNRQTMIIRGGEHLKNPSFDPFAQVGDVVTIDDAGDCVICDINNDGFDDIFISINQKEFLIPGTYNFFDKIKIDVVNDPEDYVYFVNNQFQISYVTPGDYNGDGKIDVMLRSQFPVWDRENDARYYPPFHILWGGKLLSNPVYVHPANDNWTPTQFALLPNTPNPFNAGTALRFYSPQEAEVNIRVYSLTGALVAEIADDVFTRGYHTIQWNPDGCASGVYFCRLESGNSLLTRKMMFMK